MRPRRRWAALLGAALALSVVSAVPASATPDNINASFATALRGPDGNVWVDGAAGSGDLHLGMAPGTRPSVVQVYPFTDSSVPGYQVFFVNPTDTLWTAGPMGVMSLGVHVDAGTSPSAMMPSVIGAAVHAVWQSGGKLWFGSWLRPQTGTGLTVQTIADLGLGMKTGTTPDIAEAGGQYDVIAFQANTGDLWFRTSPVGHPFQPTNADTHLGMKAGTSPSVAGSGSVLFEVTFVANTGHLWFGGSGGGFHDTGISVEPGTSPSIGGHGAYGIAAETAARDLSLVIVGGGFSQVTVVGGSSPVKLRATVGPSINASLIPSTATYGFEAAYIGDGGHLRYATFTSGTAPTAKFGFSDDTATGGVSVG